MKLVDLLVRELEVWPECVTYFVQDEDGEVKAGVGSGLREPFNSGIWIRHTTVDNFNFMSLLCSDWQTSIVTKDIYTKYKEETQMKQDFRNTKIRIKSEDHSKTFQEAVLEAGGSWGIFRDVRQMDKPYLFVSHSLELGWDESPSYFGTHEYKEIQFPLPTNGHVHAELMAQYAEDAKTATIPWELWQVKCDADLWHRCQEHPKWATHLEYRRKPKTHIVNGVEIPDLLIEPKCGDQYWYPHPSTKLLCGWEVSRDNVQDSYRKENKLCYENTEAGKQAAILHSKAMLGIA